MKSLYKRRIKGQALVESVVAILFIVILLSSIIGIFVFTTADTYYQQKLSFLCQQTANFANQPGVTSAQVSSFGTAFGSQLKLSNVTVTPKPININGATGTLVTITATAPIINTTLKDTAISMFPPPSQTTSFNSYNALFDVTNGGATGSTVLCPAWYVPIGTGSSLLPHSNPATATGVLMTFGVAGNSGSLPCIVYGP